MENMAIQPTLLKDFSMVKPGGEATFLEGQEKMFQQLLERMFQQHNEMEEQMVTEDIPEVEQKTETESFDESVYQALYQFLRFPPDVKKLETEESIKVAEMTEPNQRLLEPINETMEVTEQQALSTTEAPIQAKREKVTFDKTAEKPAMITDDSVQLEATSASKEAPIQMERMLTPIEEEPIVQVALNEPAEKKSTTESAKVEMTKEDKVTFEPKLATSVPPLFAAPKILSTSPTVETVEIKWQQPESFVREVGQKMEVTLEKMQPNEVKVVQVKLAPETFGEMEIRLEWEGDRVEAKIFVQQEDVKQVLEEQMPKLLEQLPSEPVVQRISIEIMPQSMFQPFMGQGGTRQQPTTDKYSYSTDKSAEEDGEEQEEPLSQLQGLSLYI